MADARRHANSAKIRKQIAADLSRKQWIVRGLLRVWEERVEAIMEAERQAEDDSNG